MSDSHPVKKSITARVTPAIAEKIEEAMRKSGMDQSDVLRHALEIGLKRWAKIEFQDTYSLLDTAIEAKIGSIPLVPLSSVADTADAPHGSHSRTATTYTRGKAKGGS